MKRLIFVVLVLAVATVALGQEKWPIRQDLVQNPTTLRALLQNRFSLVEADIENIEALARLGRASIFYVYSVTGADTYTGTDKDHPLATLDAAVGKCTANRGDVIIVLQNHAETLAGADAVDLDVAGVTVIGLGTGDDRPTFSFDTTTDEFVIGRTGDNVTIYNLCFFPAVSEVVHGIDVEDGADNVAILNCEFLESTTAANEFDKMITVAVEANDLLVQGCRFTSADAAGCTDAIEIGDGVAVRFKLIDCKFHGNFATAALFSDQTCTDALLLNNIFANEATGVAAVSLTGAWTGFAIGNKFYSDTWGTLGVTLFDPGSLKCIENYGATAADKAGSLIPSASLGQTLFDWINGADGMSTWQAGAKPANNVSLAEGLRYLVELLANGTPATITAPGTNQTILDILGTNGTTTTGAVAGSILGAIGTNEAAADTPFSSSTAESDRDGSVIERLEFLCKYFETGTPGALVAPASTYSLLDILGTDGATTTGAVAGSILGAIGTNEAAASTPFTSATVAADGDGSVLERQEFIQTRTDAILAALRAAGTGVGNIFFVDSVTGSDADTGTTWALAEATLAAAVGDATSNKGDIIFVAPGHAETLADAQITINKDGILIIGLGEGVDRPQIEFQHANSSIDITGASVRITGMDFYSSTAVTSIGLHITGADCTIEDCLFTDVGDFEFAICITLGAAAERTTIKNNRFESTPGTTGATACIDLNTGVVDRCAIVGNHIFGDFSTAAISSSQINTNLLIKDNVIDQANSGDWCIELTGASTGQIVNNMLYADAYATTLDPGSCKCLGNLAVDAIDEAGYPIPAIGDRTDNYIGTNSNNNDATTASVVANKDGSIVERQESMQIAALPSYNHPNYFVVTADMTSATWNTAAAHEIVTVTGACRVTIMVEVAATIVTVGTNGTIALGFAGNTSAIFSATALDAALTGDVFSAVYGSAATTPVGGAEASGSLTHGLLECVVVNGVDIGYTIGTNAGTTGSLKFHVWWTPLDATGACTAGAGDAL